MVLYNSTKTIAFLIDGIKAHSLKIELIEASLLIESFDWRNRHGADDPDSPYYDGDPTGSGWITSITSQGCADCWAHSAVGATEALANLYFNQHLDVNFGLNLSIQDIVSCSGAGSCSGGNPGGALNYIANTGVVDEDCFPYAGSDESCDDKCPDPDEIIRINGQDGINPLDGEENIKRNLIDHGPLNFGIDSWWHSMVLVGFDKDPADDETIWILKNSWGTGWGENGYGSLKVALSDMYLMNVLTPPVTSDISSFETVCLDSDGDGYYNWGIGGHKPPSCPTSALPDKDCDDNNPSLGPFNNDGSCKEVLVFEDVPPGSNHEASIYAIYNAGITTGCSKNPLRFCPQDPVTRAQMAAFIIRALEGEPTTNCDPNNPPFTDVDPNLPVCKYIKRLSELDITTGCPDGTYRPYNAVTRAQMAAFIIRAFEGEPPTDYCSTGSPFPDVDPNSPTCKYIKRFFELGITTGYSDGTYRPGNNVIRRQMAAFLDRAFLDTD